jgi:RHS repeat-associated protein
VRGIPRILGGVAARPVVAGAVACALLASTTILPASAAEKKPGGAAQTAKKKKKKKACPAAGTAKKKKAKKCPAPITTPPVVSTPATPPVPPADFAPALDETIATSMGDSAAFLYTGPNAVQDGVAAGTIDDVRVAVLRGRVSDRTGAPLSGVTVAVLNHPELGSTETRSDGAYDIAVNGGGQLVLTYEKSGVLPIERRVEVPWQDYVTMEDVAMTPRDPATTTIQSNGGAVQVARSSVVTDAQGTRRTTMLFKPGTTATMTFENGSQQSLPGPWTVRATEYTAGGIGQNSMPAELPPTSGYTFATELTIDQADAAGAVSIQFSAPVSVYVENFIHAPVGSDMPSGFTHNDGDGRWVADTDGRVMKLVGNGGGMADLDIDRDGGAPESPAELAALGIDAAERTALAGLYTVGQEFWRVPTQHFSSVDHNLPFGLPAGAEGPPPSSSPPTPAPTLSCGSIVACEDQSLRESLPVSGTPFSLYYASDRVPGRAAEDELDVRVTGATLPNQLKGIVVQASVAGRFFERRYAAAAYGEGPADTIAPNLHYEVPWDGTDVYDRAVQGKVPISIRISYVYPVTRYEAPDPTEANALAGKSFGTYGTPGSEFPVFEGCVNFSINGQSSNPWASAFCGYSIQRNERRGVGAWDARGIDQMGGWSLDVHHGYDPNDHTVHRGDGGTEQSDLQPPVTTLTAGGGVTNFPAANNGVATAANLNSITDIATAPDGTVYVLSFGATGGLRRVEPDGKIFEVASNAGLGLDVTFGSLAVDSQERIYVAGRDGGSHSFVVRVSSAGGITPVAGSSFAGTPAANAIGDDGPATSAKLMSVRDLAIGPDDALYIADEGFAGVPQLARVRKVDPTSGLIMSVAGGGNDPSASEDLGAGEASMAHSMEGLRGISFGPDGTMYLAMFLDDTVVKVAPDGTLTRFVGTGTGGSPNEGFPPLNSPLEGPGDLAVSRDGTVLIRTRHGGNSSSNLILSVADGRVTTVGGNTTAALLGSGANGTSALRTAYNGDRGLAVLSDGTIYARDGNQLVRKIAPRFAGFGAGEQLATSADGREIWAFNSEGRHTRTVDALSGTVLYSFTYDGEGRLTGVVDRDNRTTVIERDGNGKATAVVAPGGARTELDVNAAGYATEIRDSGGAPTKLTYDAGGLMTKLVDRRGGQHTFAYDADGRLTTDNGPSGHSLTFTRDEQLDDTTVTKTTGAGRQTTYRTRRLNNGDVEQTTTGPTGAITTLLRKSDGSTVATDADGTQTATEYAPDPRFGLNVPVASKRVTTTPGGRTSTRTFTRTATLSNAADPFSFTTLTETTNTDGHADTLTYTKATRTFSVITAGNRRGTSTLNARDALVSLTQGLSRTPTTTTYDGTGRPSDQVQGTLHQTYGYDARDRLTSSVDAAGRGETYSYNGADRLTGETNGVGGTDGFSYEAEGGLTGVTQPSGATHLQSLDGYGQLTGYTPPGGAAAQTTSRDAEGLVSARNLGAGHNVTLNRDAGGRLTAVNASGDDATFGYVGATDRPATVIADRTGSASDQTLALEWDSQSQTKLTYTGAATGVFTLAYDGRGNLTSRRIQSGSDDVTTTMTYDLDDLRTKDGPFNFTAGGTLGETTRVDDGTGRQDYGYDSLGRQTTVTGSVPTATPRFSQTHSYDAGNRLAGRAESFGAATTQLEYTYDNAGRLTKVQRGGSDSETYAYDADGNRISRTGPGVTGTEAASYDAQGRLATRGALNYGFDAAGFLTQRGSDSFGYGPRGHLQSASVGGSPVTYAYDAFGRRTARTESGQTEQYLYGNPKVSGELSASRDPGGQLTQYFYDPTGRLVGLQRGASRFYVFTDDIGSPRLVTDSAGSTVKRIDYDAYGAISSDSAPAFSLRVGFAGGLKDPTSGLLLFGARDYEPASGRWTSRDPIGFDGGQTNLYAYIADDPVNGRDPDGLDSYVFDPQAPFLSLVKYLLRPPPQKKYSCGCYPCYYRPVSPAEIAAGITQDKKDAAMRYDALRRSDGVPRL